MAKVKNLMPSAFDAGGVIIEPGKTEEVETITPAMRLMAKGGALEISGETKAAAKKEGGA